MHVKIILGSFLSPPVTPDDTLANVLILVSLSLSILGVGAGGGGGGVGGTIGLIHVLHLADRNYPVKWCSNKYIIVNISFNISRYGKGKDIPCVFVHASSPTKSICEGKDHILYLSVEVALKTKCYNNCVILQNELIFSKCLRLFHTEA